MTTTPQGQPDVVRWPVRLQPNTAEADGTAIVTIEPPDPENLLRLDIGSLVANVPVVSELGGQVIGRLHLQVDTPAGQRARALLFGGHVRHMTLTLHSDRDLQTREDRKPRLVPEVVSMLNPEP